MAIMAMAQRVAALSDDEAARVLARHAIIQQGRVWEPEELRGNLRMELRPSVEGSSLVEVAIHYLNIAGSWDYLLLARSYPPQAIEDEVNSRLRRCLTGKVAGYVPLAGKRITMPQALVAQLEADLRDDALGLWWYAWQRLEDPND